VSLEVVVDGGAPTSLCSDWLVVTMFALRLPTRSAQIELSIYRACTDERTTTVLALSVYIVTHIYASRRCWREQLWMDCFCERVPQHISDGVSVAIALLEHHPCPLAVQFRVADVEVVKRGREAWDVHVDV